MVLIMNKIEKTILILCMALAIYINIRTGIFFKNHWLIDLILSIIFSLIAISIHRFTQNYVAYLLKDMNVKVSGLLTFNPIKFISYEGILSFIFFKFGWADSSSLEKTIKGKTANQKIKIVVSGIIANFIVGLFLALLIAPLEFLSFLNLSAIVLLFSKINIYYALFSLIPIPPLDGWFLLSSLIKKKVNLKHIEFYGCLLIITLFAAGILGKIIPLIGSIILNYFIL
jgi:Zn-dependent protease